jgi:hypothetical protein
MRRIYLTAYLLFFLIAYSATGNNLIINGDFEQGNIGFTTGYTYSPVTLGPAETYTVDYNPHNTHPSFTSYGDHTTGIGKMMVINASVQSDITIWQQTVSIQNNNLYDFSFWYSSCYPLNPAIIACYINGTLLGNITFSSTTGNWNKASFSWYSNQDNIATIRLVDTRHVSDGDDFALDDISLIGPPPATVTIRGTVYDVVYDRPLQGVNVIAGVKQTQSDSDGKYEITDLAPGAIRVTASKYEYQTLSEIRTPQPGETITIDFSMGPDGVSTIIDTGFRPKVNGFGFDNWSPYDLTLVKPGLKLGAFCKGMSFAALYYYLLKISPLQDPSPPFNHPQVKFIKYTQITSSLMEWEWLELGKYEALGGPWVEKNYTIIRNQIDANIPCPISLMSDPGFLGISAGHTVLAYKVVEWSDASGNYRDIVLYDNNYHGESRIMVLKQKADGNWYLNAAYDGTYTRFIAVPAKLSADKLPTGFVFHSPGALKVSDPDGQIIDQNHSEIEGGYYRFLDIDGDGHNEQIAFVLAPKEGQYSVTVIPDTNAEPNATYSLEEQKFGKTTVVAQDVPISQIPSEPYKSIVVLPALTCEQALDLLDYNLVDQNRISRTEFEYTFRLRVVNSWIHAINDITVRLIQEPNNTTVLDDTVNFATIHAGTEALSDDTFKIRTDRTVEGLKSDVVWKVCDCKMERKTDFNHDWVVNFLDFATFAQEWLSTGIGIPQDVYPDEKVDIMDVGVFADEWLK